MDPNAHHREEEEEEEEEEWHEPQKPRQLPSDLPLSLDDRKAPSNFMGETEMWDGWQGQSQFISHTTAPINFNLSIDDREEEESFYRQAEDNDTKLMQMLAAQAQHRENGSGGDEDAIASDEKMSEDEKKSVLQKMLHMAASNGDVGRVKRLLNGPADDFIDVNAADEEGTAPLIYASCFGHQEVVSVLIDAGALVDRQDRNQWTALMWAMTNRHKDITKILLDHGASPDVKSSSGRTAFDFAAPNSEMSDYLHENGYWQGESAMGGGDFYSEGFGQDRFEQELEENEMRRRMMMDSSRDLEVDLSSVGFNEQPETPEEPDAQQEFVWDRCLYDQMFVFQEEHLDQILDIIVTNMVPQRSPSQKPVPANVIFLAARYAHYHATHDLLAALLVRAMDKINDKVEKCQWDMTVLAFWMSNATLLLHYLRKDPGLMEVTTEFQAQLSELLHEIFILIIRDAERRMDRVLDSAMLEHETIPGFEDVHFANDWNLFGRKSKAPAPEPMSIRPQMGAKRAAPQPRNITSLLSSTLFVLDLYDVHSVITGQIVSQLFYWLGAELFNHILGRRKYLARTKAMQIRMNISALEDWGRNNNRTPEHYENGSLSASGESTVDSARRHLTPVIQLLQWLQCFSSIGDDPDALNNTLSQMTRLTPQQLLHSANNYRCEVGEKGLPKPSKKHLQTLQVTAKKRREEARKNRNSVQPTKKSLELSSPPGTPRHKSQESNGGAAAADASTTSTPNGPLMMDDDHEEYDKDALMMDPSYMLTFSLPTSVDLRIGYGAGYGGLNKERERKYTPSVPPEFLSKLDFGDKKNKVDDKDWEKEGEDDE